MRPTPLDEIRRAVRGRWRTPATAATAKAVSIDTRTAKGGELFVAIVGDKHDGHDYLPAAARAGCSAAIVSVNAEIDDALAGQFPGGLISVANTGDALVELGALARSQISAEVVAVTGSVGKTTVKRMIHHVLGKHLVGSISLRSFNNRIGVPLTLLAAEVGADYTVCELGSNSPGEIAELARIVKPGVAVITAVGASHLERLGSIERVAAEKASLLGELKTGGLAVINADRPELQRAVRAYACHVVRFGASDEAELRLTGYEPRGLGQRFEVNGRLWVNLQIPGKHNAINALAAIAVARRFGLTEQQAAEALSNFAGAEMRMQVVRAGAVMVINDAYNANPMSMAAALCVLSELPGGRKMLVAGDMLELGEDTQRFHVELGKAVTQAGVGFLVTVGPLAEHIARGAVQAGLPDKRTVSYKSAKLAARHAAGWIEPGDVVLVKGSRAVGLEKVAEKIIALAGGDEKL